MLSIARQWVDGDVIASDAPDFVNFGQIPDIKATEWDELKKEMLANFTSK
jgi:hypothetical protein